jgi:hypothetical protein
MITNTRSNTTLHLSLILLAALAGFGSLSADDSNVSTTPKPAANTPAVTGSATNTVAPEQSPRGAAHNTLDGIFNRDLPDAIGQSKIHFQWRPRYEYADTELFKPSQAFTMRTIFGLTTAELHGLQGMIEAANISVIGDRDRYNAGDNNTPGTGNNGDKTLVLDPPTTEINQAWVSYNHTNWASGAKAGRQTVNLDNQRFLGAVDWRQNPQTFDALRLNNHSVKDLALSYLYLGRVNRVGGNVDHLSAPLKDFQSSSHVFHAEYAGLKPGKATAYVYLLDLENSAGNANSCATYGLSFDGQMPLNDEWKATYRAEFAWQTDYADMQPSYSAPYLHLKAGGAVDRYTFGVGYELLGADNNVGFKTPLATLHAFNGWADVFLNTPSTGLQDFYVFATFKLPHEIPLTVALHKFNAQTGGGYNYGEEVDLSASKKLGKHWTALVKYAYYDAMNGFAAAGTSPSGSNNDVHKFWLQMDFQF